MKTLRRTHLNSNWQFIETSREAAKGEWLPAQVPGHVHMDLARNGVIGDPFYRMNELGSQWIDRADWSYRTTFDWHPQDALPRRVLRFEGLDTVCSILLNGREIARHANMHVPLEIDVTDALRAGTNELRVDFISAVVEGERRKAEYCAENDLTAFAGSFPERAFVRKAQYMFGWDWGPRLVSCGIWKPVVLLEFAARITNLWARPERKKDGTFVVHVKTEIEGSGSLAHILYDADGDCVGDLTGDGDIVVKEPKLWWSHDLGEPYLYSLTTILDRGDSLFDLIEDTPIGLRTVELIQKPDAYGKSFRFELNGVPVWARGANWIPDHSFPSQVDGRQYLTQMQRAVSMNMNMLRVWGGGLHEADAFYRAADELGILVWQDFAYGCSYVPDTGEWLDVAREETAANVRRLRNHPSLVHWCGNNENLMLWDYAWGGPENRPSRFYGENIYNDVIPAVLKKLDPTRPYTVSSPWGGEKCNDDTIGDQHNWSVWHGGDWPKYTDSRARFCSEFGFASAPSLSTWRNCIATEDWSYSSPVVQWHDKTGKGFDTFQGYVRNHYPEPKSLEDWTFYSQLNQRDALRHGIEHYRRSEFCNGTLIWQLNDCWPVQSWALVDCEGRFKPAAHDMVRLYADDLVTLSRDGSTVKVHLVHDGRDHAYRNAPLQLFAIRTLTGDVLREWEEEVSLDQGERKLALEVDVAGLPTSETILYAVWIDEVDTWRLLGEPKDVKLPLPEIVCRIDDHGLLEVHSDLPVVDLMLYGPGGESPTLDNYLTLPMGGRTVTILRPGASLSGLAARSLAGVHKVKVVPGPF